MSTEFQTLDQAKHGEKISFIGTIINVGVLKSGTNDKGNYTFKRFLIQDAKATLELTAWDDEVKKFVMGGKYEIINAYAKDYKGKVGLGIQYAEVKLIGTDKQQSTMDSEIEMKSEPVPAVGHPSVEEDTKLPSIPESFSTFIEDETIALLQIEQDVKHIMAHLGTDLSKVNDSKIGMFVKEIYRESKKVKFDKA